jgi:hypothetical protein
MTIFGIDSYLLDCPSLNTLFVMIELFPKYDNIIVEASHSLTKKTLRLGILAVYRETL